MKAVKMLKGYSLYNIGEVAGFKDSFAHTLVKSGIAEYYKHVEEPEVDKMQRSKGTKKKKAKFQTYLGK